MMCRKAEANKLKRGSKRKRAESSTLGNKTRFNLIAAALSNFGRFVGLAVGLFEE